MYQYRISGDKYVLSLDNHVEIAAALAAFCQELDIRCGAVYGLGAICEATFRFLDPATKKYVDKTFSEQMEITSVVHFSCCPQYLPASQSFPMNRLFA